MMEGREMADNTCVWKMDETSHRESDAFWILQNFDWTDRNFNSPGPPNQKCERGPDFGIEAVV